MADKSKDLVITLGPVAQEGVARNSNGSSLIRLSGTMTFRDSSTGEEWGKVIETFVIAGPSGDFETEQFSREDGLARLADGADLVDQVAFEVSFVVEQPNGEHPVDVIQRGDIAFLISGKATVELRFDSGAKPKAFEFTVFGVRPTSGSTIELFEDEKIAEKAFNSLKVVDLGRRRRRRPG